MGGKDVTQVFAGLFPFFIEGFTLCELDSELYVKFKLRYLQELVLELLSQVMAVS